MKRISFLLAAALTLCLSTSSMLRADTVAADTNFINLAYMDLLQRSPSPTDIPNGLNALGSETRFQFALSLDTSNEYYQLLAGSYVQGLLGRPATPTDLSVFTALLSSNSDEFVQAQIAGSAEFFLDSGSTDAGFVTALFKDFLNRTPSSGEVAFWVGALGTMSREQVAALILGSLEYDTDLVKSYYLQFLDRPADPTGLSSFANTLNGGTLTDEQVIATLIGSQEFFNLAQPPVTAPTPEPTTVVLLGLGLATTILLRRQLAG